MKFLPTDVIREMKPSEYDALENFLYEAIYIPDGASPPPRKILERAELQVYVENFGTRAADVCFVAEVDGKIVGAEELQPPCLKKFCRAWQKKISNEYRCPSKKKIRRRASSIGNLDLKSSRSAAKNFC